MIAYSEKRYVNVTIYNGLSQEFSGDIEAWHSWIPKGGWNNFIVNFLKIDCEVSPCMSYDANLYFLNAEILEDALIKLKSIMVESINQPMFLVEQNVNDSRNIFIRVAYYGLGSLRYSVENIFYKIDETFELAAIRTGRHVQYSYVIGDGCDKFSREKDGNEKSVLLYE
jgi:hypothetical protein